MKLKTALELGQECGLTTVGDAVYNIRLHAMNIFEYSKINEEYKELIDECNEFKVTGDMLIENVLNQLAL